MGYEEIEHTADWALRVHGDNLPALFTNAALGMMELAGVRMTTGNGKERRVELQAMDAESLLVDWLHELLLAIEMEHLAFKHFDLTITEGRKLTGTYRALPIASIDKAIKAVTFNELQIQESTDGVEATIVFDV